VRPTYKLVTVHSKTLLPDTHFNKPVVHEMFIIVKEICLYQFLSKIFRDKLVMQY